MPTDEPIPGRCGASTRSDEEEYCALMAGYETDHPGTGNCKYHSGNSPDILENRSEGEQFEEGNNTSEKHGIHSQRSNYYQNRSAEQRAWIDSVVDSMMSDAPFDEEAFHKFSLVRNIAIDMHKTRNANDYIESEGLITENIVRGEDGEPVINGSGEVVTQPEENPINIAYDRLNRTMTKQLKELGLLDDPDSAQAEAGESIAEQLSKMRNSD